MNALCAHVRTTTSVAYHLFGLAARFGAPFKSLGDGVDD